jgi:hypothetical protein
MIFPEYYEKSGQFDKNRETGRLHEFSGDSRENRMSWNV